MQTTIADKPTPLSGDAAAAAPQQTESQGNQAMTQHRDTTIEPREVQDPQGRGNAGLGAGACTAGVFIRVTLAVMFLYLMAVAYLMLGIAGMALVAILFLVAFFMPLLYQALKSFVEKIGARGAGRLVKEEPR
jgi:hypothetical protein